MELATKACTLTIFELTLFGESIKFVFNNSEMNDRMQTGELCYYCKCGHRSIGLGKFAESETPVYYVTLLLHQRDWHVRRWYFELLDHRYIRLRSPNALPNAPQVGPDLRRSQANSAKQCL